MKNANKRLIISIAALVISIALAATTTFAWFTMDTTPEVNDINLNVTAQDGLYIAYGAGSMDWTTNLSLNTMTYSDVRLDSITPAGTGDDALKAGLTTSFIKLDTNSNAMVPAASAVSTPVNTNNDGKIDFLKITLEIRSQSSYSVHLGTASVTATTVPADSNMLYAWRNMDTNAPATMSALELGDAITTPITTAANAARIGFATAGASSFTKVYVPNATAGWDDAAYVVESTPWNAAQDYYKTVTENTTIPVTTNGYSSLIISGLASDDASATADNLIVTLADGDTDGWFTATIDVYVWLEGTDADCFNEILDDDLSISFSLYGLLLAA